MANKVMALTEDGRLTWCSAPPEMRGRGRCNHIAHQEEGQDIQSFLDSIHDKIAVSNGASDEIPDQHENIVKLVKEYGITRNPDWQKVISEIQNPFCIGSEDKGTFEEAKIVGFQETIEDGGNSIHIIASYEFRGRTYECDYGSIPVVHDDGTIVMDGTAWRVLPVLEQNTAGYVVYSDNIVVLQENGNVAFMVPKDEEADYIVAYGNKVPIEYVEEYFRSGTRWPGMTDGQVWAMAHIDPYVIQSFPDLTKNIRSIRSAEVSDVGDISRRRVIRYEDMVQHQISLQMRRMGNTFRSNLIKQQAIRDKGLVVPDEAHRTGKPGEMTEEELNEKYPLFYQQNLTSNIKLDLVKRSNVQNAESLNPISALSQSQKISLTGPGGYNKDKAPHDLRMPHPSQKGIVDHLVASAGKTVGFTLCMVGGEIGEDRFIHPKKGKQLSPSDFIPYKFHDDPSRANMACAHLCQACPIIGGEDPIVSTPAWDSIKGSKLGLNLRVVYSADKGTFEDAVVISESAAKRMGTVQSQKYRCYDKASVAKVKIGDRVERKQEIGHTVIKYGGVVKSVDVENGLIEVETVFEMTPGDKLSNRHGGKSVVSEIRPDAEMPHILDESTGEMVPAEIIMTPLGVAGRKNLGQVMECNAAAEKVGLHKPSGKPEDINHKSIVVNHGHRTEETAGVEFIMRLNHIAEKTLSSHADEIGRNHEYEGTRFGEMEHILLSTDSDRLQILNYLRHQEALYSHEKLRSLLKGIGVDMEGVNWD